MIPKDCINLKYLKAALLRRFWYIVLPFFAVSIATAGYCIKTPRVYKAETLLLVDRQKAPREHVESTMIEDNLKPIESEVTGNTTLIDDELERMKGVLRQKEEQVQEFEEKYLGLMPEQMENNVRTLTKLQQQINSLNATIRQTEERKVLLQTKLSKLEAARADTKGAVGQDGDLATDQEPLTLEELRLQLQNLKSRYSNKHPDVVRLVATIAKLEKEQNESTALDSDTKGTSIQPFTSETQRHMRRMLVQRKDFLSQLKLIDKQLATLAKKKKKTRRQIAQYRKRVEEGPKIEQMSVDLRQDLRETRENYQALLEKSLQAQLPENLERTPQGEQLRILAPATLPEKPVKPNHRKILVLGFLMAIACGFGLAFSREYLDPTFFSSNQLESIVKLPVLVSIPIVNTKKEYRWNILKRAGVATALVSMASVLFYELFILWKTVPATFRFPLR